MTFKKPLSRRAVLRGAGQIMVGLPFLEAMMPSLVWGAAPAIPRLVVMYGGVPTYMSGLPPLGALGTTLNNSTSSLVSVRQYVNILSNMGLPVYNKGTTPPPGGCVNQQHYTAPAPLLAGVTSQEGRPMMYQAHTVDQVFADAVGTGTRFKSIQARVQAAGYLYGSSGGMVSSRFVNGVTNTLAPIVSPLELYSTLFSGGVGANPVPVATVSNQVMNRRSVLDLVLGDANRLVSSLGGSDRIRMEQHFDEIRNIEKSLAAQPAPTTPPATGCVMPASPGIDPAVVNGGAIAGWSMETQRADAQAKILAMALACDLTRSISWQLTYDQCGLGSTFISGVNKDLHQISHDVNNDGSLRPAMEAHLNWHCARLAKLVTELLALREGNGTVLDSTFIAMGFGEGISAHGRSAMHLFTAGMPSVLKTGQHIAGNREHPARMWIAGLNALGVNTNKLGEITGPMAALLK